MRHSSHILTAIALLVAALQIYGSRVSDEYRYNWDMLPYIGSALAMGDLPKELVHKETYRIAKDAVPSEIFGYLTNRPYPKANFESADVFTAQMPYFSVKRLYPAMIWGLWKAGVNPVDATGYISAVAYFMFGLVVFLWLRSAISGWLAAAVALATSPILLPVAYFPTPDALAAALILAMLYTIAERKWRIGIAIGTVAVLARPDAILAVVALSGYLVWRGKDIRPAVVCAFCGALAFGFATKGGYPWSTLIYHSFIEHQLEPAAFASPLTTPDYVSLYVREFARTWDLNIPFFIFIGIGSLGAIMRAQRAGWNDTYTLLFGVCLACIVGHWTIFPAGLSRHLAPYYAAILVLLFVSLAKAFADRQQRGMPSHPIENKE
jgi:hypothetical protein